MAYIEMAVGFGLGIGPVIGEYVEEHLKYELTMYVFGVINFIGLLCCVFMIPGDLN
jgi:predicted MFS family arabinose efflux permease